MTWDITNNNYDDIHIKFNNGLVATYVPKFRIYMTVTEPYLYLYWTDTELGGAGLTRMLQIDFNDVSSLPASAAALKTLIEGYIVSGIGGLTSVSADGVTITGDGTPGDPLIGVDASGSGVMTGGVISIGVGGAGVATTFSITAGTGQITDNTVSPNTTTAVSWTAKTNVAVTNILTNLVTFVAIDSGGNVIQSTTDFTPAQMRQYIVIGIVVHSNQTTVNAVNQTQIVAYNTGNQYNDLLYSLGLFNVSGNVFSANGANLKINKSTGSVFRRGANYTSLSNNPHIITTGALTQAPLRMQNQTGPGSASTTDVDVANYDVAGVTTPIAPATRFSILRVYLFQSNLVAIQRGQAVYLSLAEAKAAIQTETFVTNTILAANGLLRGFIVAQANATSLSDASKVFFIESGKFGGTSGVGGLSVSTLQNAYDNSSDPEILTNSTIGAVTIKRGSGADTDAVLEVQNGAGTPVATITGEGNVTVLDEVYGAGWDGSTEVPTKNAVYDKIESIPVGGDVVGPASAINDNIAVFNGTSGKTIKDGGFAISQFLTSQTIQPAIGLNTAQTNVTWTVNSSGISFDASGYAGIGTSATNASITLNSNGLQISVAPPSGGIGIAAGTRTATTSGTLVFTNQNNVSFGLNAVGGSIMSASIPDFVQQIDAGGGGVGAAVITFGNANNVSFAISGGSVVGSIRSDYLTSQTVQPAVGLNTAQTNVTWTVNSSGISLNASGYAGIGTSATNASITLNSNGLAISVAAPGGGVTPAISGSNGSFSYSTVTFGNLNGASFYTSNGSMVMSYTVPAGGSPNWELEGNNTAGTTASNGNNTLFFSGGNNITLSGNSNTIIISAGAGGGVAVSRYPVMPQAVAISACPLGTTGNTGGSTQITGSGFIMFRPIPNDIHFIDLMMEHNASSTSVGTGSATIGHMLGIYSLSANTRLSLVSSFQAVMFMSQNSVTARTHQWHWGSNSATNSTNVQGNVSASFSGLRWMYLNQSEQTLAAGNYYIGYMQTMISAGSLMYLHSAALFQSASGYNNASVVGTAAVPINDFARGFNGAFSTTTNVSSVDVYMMPSTIHTSAISGNQNITQLRDPYFVMNRYIST